MSDPLHRFHEEGYLGPLQLATSFSGDRLLERVNQLISDGSELSGHGTYARHLDSRLILDLCTDSAIVGMLRVLAGPDLILWNSSFWVMSPGSTPTPWHQDLYYWPTALTLTCWIALTATEERTGCLLVAPGSHVCIAPVAKGVGEKFEEFIPPQEAARWETRPLPMDAGEFVILSDRILHRSAANLGSDDRVALVGRFTLPSVKVHGSVLPLFPNHYSILVSGEDHFGINRLGPPPGR